MGHISVAISNEERAAKHKAARVKRQVPAQWAHAVDALAQRARGEPVWLKNIAWLERLQAFDAEHGNAIACSLGDFEIGEKAKKMAETVTELLALLVEQNEDTASEEQQKLGIVRELCASIGVPVPVGNTAPGVIARAECLIWWRRALRKRVARVIEHGAIKLGLVNKKAGAYASADAVGRRTQQLARNAAMLEKTLVRNEAGQVYSLAELAAFSVANRDVRRGELMTRIRGCEEYAQQAGHVGVFFTLTCPSRFHAMHAPKTAGGRAHKNGKYDGSTPRDAQAWLCAMWARARAKLARMGTLTYGFRVAEPHHDGCPHWHALLWFSDSRTAAAAVEVIRSYWLSEAGNERGAQQNRVNTKTMVSGGAAGYIAKYIAKNIGGSVDVGEHLDGTGGGEQVEAFAVETGEVQGYQRVDAWAATWGIRQFQAIGQPPVSVWRELRRVTFDQVEQARVEGESKPWALWGTVHRDGDEKADWCLFTRRMGGMGCKRGAWALAVAKRVTTRTNSYKETLENKRAVGLETATGRWLVSRRQAWVRVGDEGVRGTDAGSEVPAIRAALAAPWTRFNNCTARLTGELRKAFMGRGRHEQSDWQNAAGVAEALREEQIKGEKCKDKNQQAGINGRRDPLRCSDTPSVSTNGSRWMQIA